jgi:hypothetical protein
MDVTKPFVNDSFSLKDSGYSNYEGTTNFPRHRWYYYKEGFSPLLVESAIAHANLEKTDLILDPFNGSGTTTLTASLSGYNSVGIEVNPFTSFLAEAKNSNADEQELDAALRKVLKGVKRGSSSPLIGFSTFSEKPELDKWLFNSDVLKAFEGGWKSTAKILDRNVRVLIRLALISAAMKNCNATRDGKCLRYRSSWRQYGFSSDTLASDLRDIVDQIRNDVSSHRIGVPAVVLNNDSRRALVSEDSINGFRLCVTSPPYLNTFDYTDIYRPELFLGKFINSQLQLRLLRHETLRSHLQVRWNKPVLSDFGEVYEKTIIHLRKSIGQLMDKNIPIMVQAYFEDMSRIFRELRKKAGRRCQLWLVVSNSAYADREIPVDLILADVATKNGWFLKEIGVLRYLKKRKTKHSPNINELRESVVILTSDK